MYRSISTLESNFHLHALCIDKKSHDLLLSLNLPNVTPYDAHQIEEESEELQAFKNNSEKSRRWAWAGAIPYGDDYANYCWALTPFFCHYLLKNKNIDSLLYVDADIYFYSDINLIFEEISDKSIGIVTHRTEHHLTDETEAGKYNVGIVYFKNDETGFECATFWKDLLLNPHNPYSDHYGTCGDQKYLELFEIKFDPSKICVIDSLAGHGAPWSFESYKYIDKYKIEWRGTEQQLIFNHFSHFLFNENDWSSSYNGEWAPENLNPHVMEYYQDYYREMKKTKEIYSI